MEKIISLLFTKKPSLYFCLFMDLVGMLSYFFPGLGEWADVVWAPISAYVFYQFFGGIGGILGGAFSFTEEILPYTDIIPTFTIAWFIQKNMNSTKSNKSNSKDIEDAEVIEIK